MGKIKNVPIEFDIGSVVYLKTDPEQLVRYVTGILIKPNNTVMYELASLEDVSYHYNFEITADPNVLLKMQ